MNTKSYWENRYSVGGNSGIGSYGDIAKFKAEIINNFVNQEKIESILELGCGDGNQLNLYNFDNIDYLGLDISDFIIKKCKNLFKDKNNYNFFQLDSYNHNKNVDLTLSIDVIFHILEDSNFNEYMYKLFTYTNKYVIIYSSDYDSNKVGHMYRRKFSEYVKNNFPNFSLLTNIHHPFSNTISESSFYIYKKIN